MNQNCNNKKYNSSTGCSFHRREIVIGICALCLNERLLILASKQASSTNTSSTDHRDRYFRSDSSSSVTVDKTGGLFRRNRKYWFSSNSSRNNKSSSSAAVVNSSYAKIFAFGSYFFNTSGNRLEVINLKSNDDDSDYDDCASTASQDDDSFISIKFEDNGDTSWEEDKTIASKVSLEHCKVTTWNHSLRKETPKRGVIEPFKEPSIKESKSVIEHAKPRGTLRWRKRIGHLFQLIKWKRSNKTNVCHVNNKVDGVKIRKSWIRTLIKRGTTQ